MNRNTTTALLAVIAVLLGLNLIAKSSPAAVGQGQAGPVQPVVVSMAVDKDKCTTGFFAVYRIFRVWSDGTTDMKWVELDHNPGVQCQILNECGPIPVIPGSCTADITRNGEVEITDFLEVLGQWGPCE